MSGPSHGFIGVGNQPMDILRDADAVAGGPSWRGPEPCPNPLMSTEASRSLRALMPALANKTYFNYGGQGPLPTPSLQAITEVWRCLQDLGPFSGEVWPTIDRLTSGLRARLGTLCGVAPHRIALTENVTSGCVLPLWGLPWRAGDEILLSDCEHPGVVAACRELARREGCTLATLPMLSLCCRTPADRLESAVLDTVEQALTPSTRLVVLSHLLWNTGSVMPIASVAGRLLDHPSQPWLLVDAAQSVGSLPVAEAAAAADIFAFTGHKWCCGPEGLGGVALSERVLEQATPTLIGWRSLGDEQEAGGGFHRDARRFEVATSCTPLLSGLATSLDLLEDCGSAGVRLQRIRALSRRLWEGLVRIEAIEPLLPEPPPAGLVSFTVANTQPAGIVRFLGERRIWLRDLPHPACLRACTHITSTEEEVDQLLSELEGRTGGRE
jgi:L-cysteine/cystine lyase